MANPKSIALPLARQEYNSIDETVTRRIIEQAVHTNNYFFLSLNF